MDPQKYTASQFPSRLASQPSSQTSELPALPSLEHLKKQAKDLLASFQSGDTAADERLRQWFPELPVGQIKLTQAQLVLAREYGFPSWARFRQAILKALVERLATYHWSEWRLAAAARAALVQAGAVGMRAAIEGLSHPEPRVRRGAADFMDHHADDSCVPKLSELALHDPVPYVRRTAVHALKCQRCKPSPLTADVTPLLARVAQEDSSARVRTEAMGSLDTAQLMRAAQEDPSPRVRQRAVASLGTEQLARAAREDPSPRVRLRALGALGARLGSVVAQHALEAALHEETREDVRRAAHLALKRVSLEYRQLAAERARDASMAQVSSA